MQAKAGNERDERDSSRFRSSERFQRGTVFCAHVEDALATKQQWTLAKKTLSRLSPCHVVAFFGTVNSEKRGMAADWIVTQPYYGDWHFQDL